MGISLKKGQRISLTKDNKGLSKILVGLGWDQVKQNQSGGFLSSLFGSKQEDIDCDASVFMIDSNNRVGEVVYFGHLDSDDGSIHHNGDNLTGAGDGDDEQIIVDLSRVPEHIQKLVFIVNIYDCIKRRQHFGMIENAFIRIEDASTNKELVIFNLSQGYDNKTGLYAGEIYRNNGEWKFAAIGEADTSTGLKDMMNNYTSRL